VVFDLAGTMGEDRGQVPSAFNAACAEHGVAVTPDQLSRVRFLQARGRAATGPRRAEPRRSRRSRLHVVIRKNNRCGMSRGLSLKTVLVMQTPEDWYRGDSMAGGEPMIWWTAD